MRDSIRYLGFIAAAILLFLMAIMLLGCATPPPDVHVNTSCPQPAADTLTPPVSLPQIPTLPGDDPSTVISRLSEVIALDADILKRESGRRQTLVDHGVRLCGWTR